MLTVAVVWGSIITVKIKNEHTRSFHVGPVGAQPSYQPQWPPLRQSFHNYNDTGHVLLVSKYNFFLSACKYQAQL